MEFTDDNDFNCVSDNEEEYTALKKNIIHSKTQLEFLRYLNDK